MTQSRLQKSSNLGEGTLIQRERDQLERLKEKQKQEIQQMIENEKREEEVRRKNREKQINDKRR